MARKPKGGSPPVNPRSGKPYSEAYWKRLQAAEAKGKTRQEARGHKQPSGGPGEYKRRAQKEEAKYGATPSERAKRLTKSERAEIKAYAQHRAEMRGRGTGRNDFVAGMEGYAAAQGMDRFRAMAEATDFTPNSRVRAIQMWDTYDEYDDGEYFELAWIFYEEAG